MANIGMHERDEKRGEDEVEGEVLVSALLLNLRLEDFLGHFFTQRLQLPRRISPLCPPLFASASPGFSMPLFTGIASTPVQRLEVLYRCTC